MRIIELQTLKDVLFAPAICGMYKGPTGAMCATGKAAELGQDEGKEFINTLVSEVMALYDPAGDREPIEGSRTDKFVKIVKKNDDCALMCTPFHLEHRNFKTHLEASVEAVRLFESEGLYTLTSEASEFLDSLVDTLNPSEVLDRELALR